MIQIRILTELKEHAYSFLSLNGNHGKPGEKESRKEEAGSGQAWGPPSSPLIPHEPWGSWLHAHSETEAQETI